MQDHTVSDQTQVIDENGDTWHLQMLNTTSSNTQKSSLPVCLFEKKGEIKSYLMYAHQFDEQTLPNASEVVQINIGRNAGDRVVEANFPLQNLPQTLKDALTGQYTHALISAGFLVANNAFDCLYGLTTQKQDAIHETVQKEASNLDHTIEALLTGNPKQTPKAIRAGLEEDARLAETTRKNIMHIYDSEGEEAAIELAKEIKNKRASQQESYAEYINQNRQTYHNNPASMGRS